MQTTTALRLYGKRDLRLETFTLPAMQDDEILARVVTDSLCLSSWKEANQGADHKKVPDDVATRPIIIGHEFCGEILAVGKKWQHKFQPGQRYVIQANLQLPDRPDCPGYSFPWIGGEATHVVIPNEVMAQDCLLTWEGDTWFEGSLVEPLSCVIGAFNANYHLQEGSYNHVMGIRPQGHTLILGGPAPMRRRAEPPRGTRLSRKVLAGLGLVASVGLGGALIYALQTRDAGRPNDELYSTENRSTADGLAGLPRDYSGVPQLGPPLPGDLGRPILSTQDRGQPVPTPGTATPNPGISPEEQRRLQEIETARTSRLFSGSESRGTPAAAGAAPALAPVPDLASIGLAPPPATPSAQDRQNAFLNAAADRRTVAPDRVAAPVSPNVLQAGAVISAALITGIRSDLPGQITAQVTENIYDSPTGRILLVPQGTRVVGQYDNNVQFGQSRVLLVWTRLVFPNGRSIVLERQPGADAEGFAGLQDGVDYHWWDLAKAAGLSTLLSVGAELAVDNDDQLVQAIRNGGQDTINDAGQQIVRRQLNVAPTITIRPGFPVRVLVTRDLVLEPYGG